MPTLSRRTSKAALAALLVSSAPLLVSALTPRATFADAPTDIVPRGSAINDAFGLLARYGVLPANVVSSSYAGRPVYTRAQFARVLQTNVLPVGANRRLAEACPQTAQAVRSLLLALRPELEADGVDVRAALRDFEQSAFPAGSLLLQPEVRFKAGGENGADARAVGLYRATAQGEFGANFRYVGSFSNWAQEYRRDFFNDTGAAYFPQLNELYVEGRAGKHQSFTYGIGRRYENWGPGMRNGGVLLSDNAPALDQIRFAFPFNLGRTLGRDWNFTQVSGVFDSSVSSRRYLEARRVERRFSSKWSADIQESILTTDSDAAGKLFFLPFAVNSIQRGLRQTTGIRLREDLDNRLNYTVAAGVTYQSEPRTRAYGQFFIDDLKNPTSGGSKNTPRKIAYLLGGSIGLGEKTDLTAEYATADPTTYTFKNNNAPWRRSPISNNFGLPGGPNVRDIYVRVSHEASPKLLLSLEGRDRRRRSDSFPAPTASAVEAAALYRLDARSSVEFSYRAYRQNPYPIAPGSASYPFIDPNYVDASQANPGERLRRSEVQLAYRFWL